MSQFRVFLLLICICTLFQCQLEESPAQTKNITEKLSVKGSNIDLLIFKKEMKLELWRTDSLCKERISRLDLQKKAFYPIGIYGLLSKNGEWLPNIEENKALRKGLQLNRKSFPKNLPLAYEEKQTDLLSLLAVEDTAHVGRQLKEAKSAQILVLPSDSRTGKPFEGRLNGEPWFPELYSSLELWIKDFQPPINR